MGVYTAMRIAIPKETHPGENRVPITPDIAKKLCGLGAELVVESGMGFGAGFQDAEYEAAGASVSNDRSALLSSADILLRVRKPQLDEIAQMKNGCIHISYLDPFMLEILQCALLWLVKKLDAIAQPARAQLRSHTRTGT